MTKQFIGRPQTPVWADKKVEVNKFMRYTAIYSDPTVLVILPSNAHLSTSLDLDVPDKLSGQYHVVDVCIASVRMYHVQN